MTGLVRGVSPWDEDPYPPGEGPLSRPGSACKERDEPDGKAKGTDEGRSETQRCTLTFSAATCTASISVMLSLRHSRIVYDIGLFPKASGIPEVFKQR